METTGTEETGTDTLFRKGDTYAELARDLNRESLGRVCRQIISWYREKAYEQINTFFTRAAVSESNPGSVRQKRAAGKRPRADSLSMKQKFYYLVKLYHPDMAEQHLSRLQTADREQDAAVLAWYKSLAGAMSALTPGMRSDAHGKRSDAHGKRSDAHGKRSSGRTSDRQESRDAWESRGFEDFAYTETYGVDVEDGFGEETFGFSEEAYHTQDVPNDHQDESEVIGILNALYFGNNPVSFEPVDLQQIHGELDLSFHEIRGLGGLEHCSNLTSLNLAGNELSNIYEIGFLDRLTELDLSGNTVYDISALSGLHELETLFLDDNEIEDMAPLLELDQLRFVSLSGNPIRDSGVIRQLSERGVTVVFL